MALRKQATLQSLPCVAILLIALIVPVVDTFALDPDKSITQYVHDIWQSEQGLPQSSINCILQTRDGYLWLGTEEGLARFDGVQFTIFDKSNTPEIRNNWIRVLYEDREGSLWVGTIGGGLSRLRDGKWDGFTTTEGLSNNIVNAILQDKTGNFWFATEGGLSRFHNGKWTAFTSKEGLSNDAVRSLCLARHGALWAGTRRGLNRLLEGNRIDRSISKELSNAEIRSVMEDRQGNIWIATGAGIRCFRDGQWSGYTTQDGLSSDSVRNLYEDREGSLWIGTDEGLNRLRDGKLTSFSTKQGLSSDVVWSMYEDREGSLWIGTNGGGLNRFFDGKFTAYSTKEGLSNDIVRSILQDTQGALWFGTNGGGLNRLLNGSFTAFTRKDGLSNDRVWPLLQAADGSLWIGTNGGGLNHFEDGKFTTYTNKQGLANDEVRVLLQDSTGGLWIGTSVGVSHLVDGDFVSDPRVQSLASDDVRALLEDIHGDLWIGTIGGGLRRLTNSGITTYSTKNGLASDEVFSLFQDGNGKLWIGTSGGLSLYDNGKFTSFTTRDGLFEGKILVILEDNLRNLWFSTNQGVFRVRKQELESFARGETKSVTSISYDTGDGMRSAECNGGTQPAGFKTKDGRLWFATLEGAVVIDPERIPINQLPPPVHIEAIFVDGAPAPNPLQGAPLKITPGKGKFEFHYTALSFLVPRRVKFKYKLEGFDNDWVDAGTRRIAYYTNIAPGNYRFKVKACNNDGIWNEAGATAAFYLQPHFYQTYTFLVFSLLTVLSAAIGTHRLRVRRLRVREKELVRIVDERTRDLREANERIARLQASAPQALENLSAWSKSAAEDIAHVIGATEIAIWMLEQNGMKLVSGAATKVPPLEALKTAGPFTKMEGTGETLVTLLGLSGEIYGVLVISGSNIAWDEAQKQLVAAFAQQLGGTLETQHMAKRLRQAEERRAMKQQEMREQGIPTLQICPVCGSCYGDTFDCCEKEGAKLHSPRTLPYRIMDRYRLSRMLDEGGMGAVFEAYDEKLNRSVAIKIIRAELLNDPSMRMRLEREAHVVARIRHPGVVSIYDFGDLFDGSAFIVMELLQGLDLAETMKNQGPGTPAQVAALLKQVGEALTVAHSLGIIHRDLKPANLFILPAGKEFQVKVVDFGIAKSVGEQTSLTISGMLVGTPAYMSPEQIRHQPLDARSDLFSLAAVAYELLTGVTAFGSEHISDALTRVLLEEPSPISSKLPGASPDLDMLFSQALQKDVEKRPKNVAVWIEQLEPLLNKMVPAVRGWQIETLMELSRQRTSSREDKRSMRWQEIWTTLHSALQYEPESRNSFLLKSCAEDPIALRTVGSALNAPEGCGSGVEFWKNMEEIFYAALDHDPDQRTEFLDKACAGNSILREKVEALLSADQEIKEEEFPSA